MLQRSARLHALRGRPAAMFTHRQIVPMYGVFGLLLLAGSWIVAWEQVRPVSTFSFFPLWLGYTLLVDSVVLRRRGTSLMTESRGSFARMFLVSAAFWWCFEALNLVVHNWHYLGTEGFSPLGYFLYASVAFSTVIPAVLETATLIASFFAPDTFFTPVRTTAPLRRLTIVAAIGVATFLAPFAWPNQAYGLVWISALLIVEPVNWMLGRPSVFRLLASNRLALLLVLAGTGMVCGPLWELWNFYSYPKWYYILPGIAGPKFFEMPLTGMLGYPPFMIEVYAMYNLLLPLFGRYSTFERVIQAPPAQ